MKGKDQKPVLTTLRNLGAKEMIAFPAKRTSYVRSCCTMFGFEWGREFKTHINKEDNTIEVTRIR